MTQIIKQLHRLKGQQQVKKSSNKKSAAHSRATSQAKTIAQRHAYLEDNRDDAMQRHAIKSSSNKSLSQESPISPEKNMSPEKKISQKKSAPNNTGLPDNLKSGMENLSGMSLDHVKVHYNSSKPAAVQAHAYAQGSDIHLSSGQEKHLPHELGHVVQQMQGRVTANTSVNGMAVNDNPGLETDATVMGDKALRGG